MKKKPMLSAAEIGKIHNVHRKTVAGWAARGCPHQRHDGALRFNPTDVSGWLVESKTPLHAGRPAAELSPLERKAQLKLLSQRIEKLDLELRHLRATLVPIEKVAEGRQQLVDFFMTWANGLVRQTASFVGKDESELTAMMTGLRDDLYSAIRDGTPACLPGEEPLPTA